MDRKHSNLCLSADVETVAELEALVHAVGPYICCLKTHCDIISDWTAQTPALLAALATKYDFYIFEDRKFADIGNTVASQFTGGVHKISSWADFVNAHILPGPGIIQALQAPMATSHCKGLLLLAQMSSQGNLLDEKYTAEAVRLAEANSDVVFGAFCFRAPQAVNHDSLQDSLPKSGCGT